MARLRFFRHEALVNAGTPPSKRIWVQVFKGEGDATARDFALEINRRRHLGMHSKQIRQAYWLAHLCGEIEFSVRVAAVRFRMNPSTVQRVHTEAKDVRIKLQSMAAERGEVFSTAFIRENAPRWQDLSTWQANAQPISPDYDPDAAAEAKIVEDLLKHAPLIRANPEVLYRAVATAHEALTGHSIRVVHGSEGEESQEEF